MWYSYTPDVRNCPEVGTSIGSWNIVNTNQISSPNFEEAQNQDKWTESVDNLGPRYFTAI